MIQYRTHVIKYCIAVMMLAAACSYRIKKDAHGEPTMTKDLYTFSKTMTAADGQILDTGALYLQVFDPVNSNAAERANPVILKFFADGYYKLNSLKYYQKFDNTRTRQSVYYGGKFYLNGNKLFFESFYPVHGGETKRYSREISKGSINNDTLKVVIFGHEKTYLKKYYNQIF